MSRLAPATGRLTAAGLLVAILSGLPVFAHAALRGGVHPEPRGVSIESLSMQALAALAFLLAGACIQAMRARPLRRRNAELERLLDERTQSLGQLSVELESAKGLVSETERASSRFLSNVSHELRTPLNSILGFSELLLEGIGSIAEDKQTRFLSNVRRSAQHLLSLINDVVDMSKIESGRMELHVDRVAIEPLVGSTVEMIAGFATPRRITVTSDIARELPMIYADAMKVRQIVFNLLANGVRFSVAGGTVELSVRLIDLEVSPLEDDAIEIRVTDHGSGILDEDLRALFAEHRQMVIASKLGLVTGLGLAIVRKFAEMHGGRFAVESKPGEGSTFRVWLPLDAREFDTDKISMTV